MGNVSTAVIGRPYGCISIHPHEEFVIMESLLQYPEKTIAEMVEQVYSETGQVYACSTLYRYLKRNSTTRKKVCAQFLIICFYKHKKYNCIIILKMRTKMMIFIFTVFQLVNIALQRSEDARAYFRAVTCMLPAEMFVLIDESGFVSAIIVSLDHKVASTFL